MTFFAKINENSIVVEVLRVDPSMPNGGLDWLEQNFGKEWVETDKYTYGGDHLEGGSPLRKNYAGVGFLYDAVRDAFIPPKPYDSWILNEDTCLWEAPIPYPNDDGIYMWDEESTSWIPAE